MTSVIKVDTIQNSSGTSSMSIASNGFVIPPAGGIIQTQYTQIDATSQWTVNQNTDKQITVLAVNITPVSANSIIKIEAMVNGEWSDAGAPYNSTWFFFRDSTKLATTVSSNNAGILMGTSLTYEAVDASSTPEHANYMYFDSPSSTSQITYTVGVRTSQPSTYWNLNRTHNNSGENGVSVITATEIAG